MLDLLPFTASSLFAGAAIWLGVLGLLVALTRGISKSLAWVFLVSGLVAPLLVVHSCTGVAAANCQEDEVNQGLSADAQYEFAIVEVRCSGSPVSEFEVRIGQRDDLGTLKTVFLSDGSRKPAAVKQQGDHEFMVVMAPVSRVSMTASTQPVMVRMDPQTGQPHDTFDFRQADLRS